MDRLQPYGLERLERELMVRHADIYAQADVEGRVPSLPYSINRDPVQWWKPYGNVTELKPIPRV